VVVGGGWSGIAAAWELRRRGLPVELHEDGDRLGGRSELGELDGDPVAFGGKNVGRRAVLLRAFCSELGEERWEHFGPNTSRIDRGRVRTVDGGRGLRGALSLARSVAPRDAVKAAYLARTVRTDDRERFLAAPRLTALAERWGDPPLDRAFGSRLRETVLRPMTVRMNGAEPGEVHLGTLGTNLGMLLDTHDQLTPGFAPVLEAFARRVTVHLGSRAEELVVEDSRIAGVRVRDRDGSLSTRDA